jgi:hypothetical protein
MAPFKALTPRQEVFVAEGVVALLAERRLVDRVLDEAALQHLRHVLPGVATILGPMLLFLKYLLRKHWRF